MRIIGIDPGLTKTGWGIIDIKNNNISFIATGTIYSSAKDPISQRLYHFYQELSRVIDDYQPEIASIEETFININPLSSLKLGHIRGAIILTVAKKNITVFEYSATAVKKTIFGNGRADKNQIKMMVKILLPKAVPNTEDEADALALAICHFHHSQQFIKKLDF
jgi:crossover junction endodeoxyribonuclease RuvC